MPDRPVWGYSNDDMPSGAKHLGRNWSMLLLPELTSDWVRRGLIGGRSYFVYSPAGHAGPPPPARIRSGCFISTNQTACRRSTMR